MFYETLKKNIAGIHLQRLYSDRRNMPLGLTAIKAQSIYIILFYFPLIFLQFSLLFCFCLPVLGWKVNSICYDGPLKVHKMKEFSSEVFLK